uniref:Uncharacterized protein n=1 Tax=Romanomermis culicivorax TaxID=13658 RepID=A0A915JGS8_ROMCU
MEPNSAYISRLKRDYNCLQQEIVKSQKLQHNSSKELHIIRWWNPRGKNFMMYGKSRSNDTQILGEHESNLN